MGLPLVPILSALTPVVLGAFDLYRKRREAREANSTAPFQTDGPRTSEVLLKRMEELEASDVEQARLISQLSNTVEALAKNLQQEIEAGRRRDVQLRQRLWIAYGVAGVSALLALWVGLR
jgi:hypothetical protein